jgi:cellulose biosynthesis protein BcsQ
VAKSIAFFNHKGGVGKTTLTVNIARALGQLGCRTLVVDADPQCNATAFYLREEDVDQLLDESIDPEEGGTLWSGIAKYVRARGEVRAVAAWQIGSDDNSNVFLLPGDVLLGAFEDKLSAAWKDSFSRDATAIDLMSAVYRCACLTAESMNADVLLFDVGPSVGSLNRAIILGCDAYVIPVACDLFSLRALRTVGHTLSSWIEDWQTISKLAKKVPDVTLLPGRPVFVGYIAQHFNIYRGRSASAFEEWERRIAPRVTRDIRNVLNSVTGVPDLAPDFGGNRLGAVPAFHSLAPLAQRHGVPIGGLRGYEDVNTGWHSKIDESDALFQDLASTLRKRIGI